MQRKVTENVPLPPGYRLEWVGEFGNLQDAIERLKLTVPVTIGPIALLLYLNFASVIDVLLSLSVIPMAMIGGIFALLLTGTPFSISAAIGFIALFGISVMESVILISYFYIPDRFKLIIQADNLSQPYHIVWRKERRVGVAFD